MNLIEQKSLEWHEQNPGALFFVEDHYINYIFMSGILFHFSQNVLSATTINKINIPSYFLSLRNLNIALLHTCKSLHIVHMYTR